jgi:hypothetical protein
MSASILSSLHAERRARARTLVSTVVVLALAGCGGSSGPQAEPSTGTAPQTSASAGAPPPATTAAGSTSRPATTSRPSRSPTASSATYRVVSSRVAASWRWPNDPGTPGRVDHRVPVPPVPELVRINVASHAAAGGQPPYDRIAFTFTHAFPSYRYEFTDGLTGDPSGLPVAVGGLGVLTITFTSAQAHTDSVPVRSSIVSQPARPVDHVRIVDFARAGDVEGVLTYGVGVTWPIPKSNPQFDVRAFEVEAVTGTGQHQYVVAVDIDDANPSAS